MRLWSVGFLSGLCVWALGCQPPTSTRAPEAPQVALEPEGDELRSAADLLLGASRASALREMNTPQRWGTLLVAQETSREVLDDDAGLTPSAARNIVSYRAGEDGAEGTEDDRFIDTLAELDAIPRVGDATLAALRDYAAKVTPREEVTLWLGLPCVAARCLPVEGWDPLDHLDEAAEEARRLLETPDVALYKIRWIAPQPLRPRYTETPRLKWTYLFARANDDPARELALIHVNDHRAELALVAPIDASALFPLEQAPLVSPGGFPEARRDLEVLYPEEFFDQGSLEAMPSGQPVFRFVATTSGHERRFGEAPEEEGGLTALKAGQRCTAAQRSPGPETLRLHFIDVGQGDAIWVQSPTGQNLLIDAGDSGFVGRANGGRIVTQYMLAHGLKEGDRLDAVVVSHAHSDHFGGLVTVMASFEVGAFLDPGVDLGGRTWNSVLTGAQRRAGERFYHPAIGPRGAVQAPGAEVDFLGPQVKVFVMQGGAHGDEEIREDDGTAINDTSLILRLEFAGRAALLMGDAEEDAEERLLARYGDPRQGRAALEADLLKVPHHGSLSSTHPALLEAVFGGGEGEKKYAVIQSGRQRFSGTTLPARETVLRLQERLGADGLFSTEAGDDHKEGREAAGDDHVLAVITPSGALTVCYP